VRDAEIDSTHPGQRVEDVDTLSGLEVEHAQWLKPFLDRLGHKKGEQWRRRPPPSGTSVNAAGGAANWLFSSPDTSAAVPQLIAEAAKTTRWT
jgi:hypothetical protein